MARKFGDAYVVCFNTASGKYYCNNRKIFSIKSYDAYEENGCLQVNFKDNEGTWVLTNPFQYRKR